MAGRRHRHGAAFTGHRRDPHSLPREVGGNHGECRRRAGLDRRVSGVIGVVFLLIGGFLSFKAYGRE